MSGKTYKRNLTPEWAPSVERAGDKVKLFQSLYAGKTRYEIRGLITASQATNLVFLLKKAIREIHADERGRIEQQEKVLSS